MASILPDFIQALRQQVSPAHLAIIDRVWGDQSSYLRWPKRALLFMPNIVKDRYHAYTPEQKAQIRAAQVRPDTRSNGPAIMAFLVAGGERPPRANGRERWTIHHIYDSQFPAAGRRCTHAVKAGQYFTEAAGLVAAHPIADALADEFAYFAWLLRFEAYARFGFDPDAVFGSGERAV